LLGDLTDKEAYLSYDVGTVKPNGLSDDRELPPQLSYQDVQDVLLLGHTSLTASMISNKYDNMDDYNPAEIFEETITLYKDYAPWFYEVTRDEQGNVINAPGMALLLEHLWLDKAIDENDPRLKELKSDWTVGQIRFINAGGLKNPDYDTNARLSELRDASIDTVNTTLTKIGIDVEDFIDSNYEGYQNLVDVFTRGYLNSANLDTFIKHYTGVEKLNESDARYLSFKNIIEEQVDGEIKYSLGAFDFRKAKEAERLGIRYLGQARYQSLDEETKKEISFLVSTDQQSDAEEILQGLFDSDPFFEKYAGKNLNYGQIVGPYKQLYTSIFGDSPDEEDTYFLETVGLDFQDAGKSMRKKAYETGNEYFGRTVASSMNRSLGGNVIRGI